MRAYLDGPAQHSRAFHVGNDPNTQSVWRQFYSRVFELPVGYNAFRSTLLADWQNAHVLHDVDVGRKALGWRAEMRADAPLALRRARAAAEQVPPAKRRYWPPAELVSVLYNLTEAADRAVDDECKRANMTNRGR